MQVTDEMIDPYLIDLATKAATASLAEHPGDPEKAATAVLVALDNDSEDMGERALKETMLTSMGPLYARPASNTSAPSVHGSAKAPSSPGTTSSASPATNGSSASTMGT